uniref:MICOS complex subunit n=1 Tax=Mycena chlorophos TaxID=658473 RepID=A0ABQ0L2K1_MYCCL|nr:predicted protein [Mycena chlorophos]
MSSSTPSAPSSSAQKLSIYPDPPRETLLLDTPSALEQHIGAVRRAATAHLRAAHAEVQGVVSRWIGVENRVEHRIKALLPPDERLTPGVLYVGVAILTGAILARHRGLPTRIVLPPVLGLGAAAHFLPKLSSNVRAYASDLEDEYTPGLAHVHETGKAHTAMGWERLKESGRGAGGRGKGQRRRQLRRGEEGLDERSHINSLDLVPAVESYKSLLHPYCHHVLRRPAPLPLPIAYHLLHAPNPVYFRPKVFLYPFCSSGSNCRYSRGLVPCECTTYSLVSFDFRATVHMLPRRQNRT